jgi:hypothetical protein
MSVLSASVANLELNIAINTMFSNTLFVHAEQVKEFYTCIDSVQDYGCIHDNV